MRHRAPIEEELNSFEEEALRRDGHRTAAWLVGKQRKKLHRYGQVLFTVPKGETPPPWFRIAVEFLKRRPGWNAIITARLGERTYRVIWLARGQWKAARQRVMS